jgi:tRNA (guanine26-N2/guanine27-N2)-dimethyltransferase
MTKEGRVLLDLEVPRVVSSKMGVFYNPYMRENRDISLLLLTALDMDGLTVCDPMGASGVRSLRFLLELPKVNRLIYNDIDPRAVEYFRGLLQRHKVDLDRVEIYNEDACLLLRRLKNCHYVDLDPYGSPVPFLESSILPLSRYGVLAVTATDTSVLSGTYPKTCLRRYGSLPLLEAEFYHEVGTRILIKKVIEEGAKLDYALTPLFSYSYRHYIRVFFLKDIGPKKADVLLERIGFLTYCPSCLYRKGIKPYPSVKGCPHCGSDLLFAGPLWLGELWKGEVLSKMWERRSMLELSENTHKILMRIREESTLHTLGFYTISSIGRAFRKGQLPPIERFLELFEAVRTHFTAEGFRTALPHEEVLRRISLL